MKHTSRLQRLMAMVLSVAMVLSLGVGSVFAVDNGSSLSYTELDAVSAQLTNTENPTPEEETQPFYDDTDVVRVTIVMEQPSAMDYADLELSEAVKSLQVAQYQTQLKVNQAAVAAKISKEVLSGQELDVVWNLTLVSNAMSANVEYGQIEAISQVDGVSAVYLETQYAPLAADVSNIVAQVTTGASSVQEDCGYTGAGTRIAIIDTGTDTDHQSFDEGSYQYALEQLAQEHGMEYDAYVESLNLLTVEEIESVLSQLHASERYEGLTAEDLYLSSKLPFNFNYVDENLDVTHDNDSMGEHGSHVAGIAAANSYIRTDGSDYYDFDGDEDFDQADAQALLDYVVKNETIHNVSMADVSGDGSVTAYDVHVLLDYLASADEDGLFYGDAEAMVGVTGTAPEAQIVTMKVFGANGGAYSSDYMAAVEDALVLGCDVVNLSLGEGNPGFSSAHESTQEDTDYVDGILDSLEATGMVMCVAAGNSGSWSVMDDAYGLMYTDEGGTSMTSAPATYTNAFSVASSDNVGMVTGCKTLFHSEAGEVIPTIQEVGDGVNNLWTSLDPNGSSTTYEVVFLGDPTGLMTDTEQTDETIYGASFEGLDLTGKIVLVARGNGVYFSAKHQGAADAGAAAVLIYNNVDGELNASIEGSEATAPCGGMTLSDAKKIFNLCENVDGVFTCEVTITSGMTVVDWGTEPTMSSFSSWGSTGGLAIKPEITAPGGNIYSVNGLDQSGTAYELMSGTSMATPHVSGLVALASQYVQENGLVEIAKTVSGLENLTQRTLIQSLLMSTAEPMMNANGYAYAVRQQGAGLANVSNLVNAETFLMVDGLADGKIKAELGDGVDGWSFSFKVYNLTDAAVNYTLDASILTTDTVEMDGYQLSAEEMIALGANVTYGGDAKDGKVTVPASGSASVTVTIQVTEEAAANMEALGYTNGFYVEGFLYLNGEEGQVSHSIPVLGWYGDWSAPSMYDNGSYIESFYGQETRPGHVPSDGKNFLAWAPNGSDTGNKYAGNVYVTTTQDETHYDPARNAINTMGTGSWTFYAIFPTLMRNAADIQLQIVDADTGKVYFVDDYEDMDDSLIASFYYPAYGDWYDTTTDYGIGTEWDYTDPDTGLPVAEGTRLSFQLLCAPEYFVQEDGSVNWDELGDGCTLSFDFTVDNTAPALAGENALTLSEDGSALTFTVQDNNYIAAVVLLDGTAADVVEYCYPDMATEAKGQAYTGTFDLTDFAATYGNKAVIAVCDYAGNERYYALNLGGEGADYGDLVAFQYDFDYSLNSWVSFDTDVNGNETQMFLSDVNFVCAEYVGGYVFAQTETGALHGFRYSDMLNNTLDLESTYIAQLDNVYQDLAYNYYDGKLYGLYTYTEDGYPTSELYTINIKGEYYDADMGMTVEPYQEDWILNRGGVYGLTLAIDDNSNIYVLGTNYDWDTESMTETAHLWSVGMEYDSWSESYVLGYALTEIGDTGLTMDYLQSMTWDHNTETLYWARFAPLTAFSTVSELLTVNTETAECTKVGDLTSETCAMFAPLSAESAAKEAHANVPEMDSSVVGTPILRDDVVTMNVGGVKTLTYDLDPWYTAHKDLVWSSDNEAVATVDENGTVTAVSEGTAIITVAAKDDATKLDTCTVQVSALDLKLEGIVSAQTAGIGSVTGVSTYEFQMDKGIPAFGTVNQITASEDLNYGLSLATSELGRGSIWACESGNTGMIYEIDPATGEVKDVLKPMDGDMLFGLTYSESQDTFTGIMNMFLYVDLELTHEEEAEMLKSYDEELHQFTYHRVNMLSYLTESNTGFVTGETGQGASSEIVFCGITTMPGGYNYEENWKDFTGNWADGMLGSYTADQTLVLMDNVGRLWYIDEIMGMTKATDDLDNVTYTSADGMTEIYGGRNGLFDMEAGVNEDGNVVYNVFYIRQIEETPLTDMFREGKMPRITYHFSDIEYAGTTADGDPIFAMSLYDYWNNGTTNELYLYIPGHETDEMDNETLEFIRTPDRLFDLGNTGEHNIIATIHSAEVTGGLDPEPEEGTNALAAGVYTK